VIPAPGTTPSHFSRANEPGSTGALDALADHARGLAHQFHGRLLQVTIESGDCRLEVEWDPSPVAGATPQHSAETVPSEPTPTTRTGRHIVTASRVGTFHVPRHRDEAAGIQPGVPVRPDTVLGELEAMHVHLPVLAGTAGVVAEMLVHDGQMVPYAQPLFILETGTS